MNLSHDNPSAVTLALRKTVRDLDPAIALADIRPLHRILTSEVEQPRFLMFVMTGFAVLALTLASVAVTQRKQELSIRIALGTEPSSVLSLVISQGLRLALIGAVIGIAGTLVCGRYMVSVLYGVPLADPWTIAGVLVVVISVASLACFIPARRAATIDPLAGLREE